MTGLGTIINTAAIAAAGFCGHLFGKLFTEDKQDALTSKLEVAKRIYGEDSEEVGDAEPVELDNYGTPLGVADSILGGGEIIE